MSRDRGDPLEITPHERFEEVTRGEAPAPDNQLETYENVIKKMAKPVMVTAAEQGLYAWKEIVEVIARISWAYRKERAQVEADLLAEGQKQLNSVVLAAALNGALVDNGTMQPLPPEDAVKKLESRNRKKLLRGPMG